jgi:hypothetical protein
MRPIRTVFVVAAFAAVAIAISSPAAGHMVKQPQRHAAQVEGKLGWHKKNLLHARSTLRWFERHAATHLYGGPLARRVRAWQIVKAHRWLKRHALRAIAAYAASLLPPHYVQWMCIHRYEGAWNDPGAPYYGGLQMDWSFMRAHGWRLLQTKGTADNWTPLEQMWVAENAWRTRGFSPWPTTARYCGLR